MACAVQERTREFGIRVALGALPRTILGTALESSLRIGVAGTVLGVVTTWFIARAIGDALYLVPGQHGGMLYGVTTTDPIAIAAACGVLMIVVIVGGVIPARHATSVDPVIALRAE
jgi:putative ABC transport system permease protein